MSKAKSPYSNLRIAMTVDPELQELLVRGGALIKSSGRGNQFTFSPGFKDAIKIMARKLMVDAAASYEKGEKFDPYERVMTLYSGASINEVLAILKDGALNGSFMPTAISSTPFNPNHPDADSANQNTSEKLETSSEPKKTPSLETRFSDDSVSTDESIAGDVDEEEEDDFYDHSLDSIPT
ncbi:hypothetical protein BWH99_RS10995 [Vibrio parahaemolyticus]|nr:hypothetical protein [Vibrio parahaemolyticus]EIA9324839.1 hypothetical protein [Vibrio parahaemolyticus]EJG1681462.1 hypothetical protein [Vibrio parahaemolyticus]